MRRLVLYFYNRQRLTEDKREGLQPPLLFSDFTQTAETRPVYFIGERAEYVQVAVHVLHSQSTDTYFFAFLSTPLTFRHRASCILGQAFHYSPENAFYIFNQQIYFII